MTKNKLFAKHFASHCFFPYLCSVSNIENYNMKKIIFSALAALALTASCSSTRQTASVSRIAGEWTIEKINGAAIDKTAGENIPFMGFDTQKKLIYGTTGCNRLTGALNADNGKIDLSKTGSTRMMCADMTNEEKVLGVLSKVKKYEINKKGNLILTDEAGNELIMLTKKK